MANKYNNINSLHALHRLVHNHPTRLVSITLNHANNRAGGVDGETGAARGGVGGGGAVPSGRTAREGARPSRLLKSGSYFGFDCPSGNFVALTAARHVFGGVAGSAGAP